MIIRLRPEPTVAYDFEWVDTGGETVARVVDISGAPGSLLGLSIAAYLPEQQGNLGTITLDIGLGIDEEDVVWIPVFLDTPMELPRLQADATPHVVDKMAEINTQGSRTEAIWSVTLHPDSAWSHKFSLDLRLDLTIPGGPYDGRIGIAHTRQGGRRPVVVVGSGNFGHLEIPPGPGRDPGPRDQIIRRRVLLESVGGLTTERVAVIGIRNTQAISELAGTNEGADFVVLTKDQRTIREGREKARLYKLQNIRYSDRFGNGGRLPDLVVAPTDHPIPTRFRNVTLVQV